MDDTYQYPIFFEHQGLGEKQIKKIETYFCGKHRSGGGNCGRLRSVDNNIYSIAFRQQRDQQAVLQKRQHTVGGLMLTVRHSLEPGCSIPMSAAAAEQEPFLQIQNEAEAVSTPMRIVLLGKTASGKSSTANTIFGEILFPTNDTAKSGTKKCQAERKTVSGRSITLIDTPGFFHTDMSEEELRYEIVSCATEQAPGPHAFLIVLKLENFAESEQAVITEICQWFSEDALKYAVIVFTHGDQLREGEKIQDFIGTHEKLRELVKMCGGRCHVIDNKYWNESSRDEYRRNCFQVQQLLKTLDKLSLVNSRSCYTHKMLPEHEERPIRYSSRKKWCKTCISLIIVIVLTVVVYYAIRFAIYLTYTL